MASFGTQKALMVERFDRRWKNIAPGAQNVAGFTPASGVWIARLPQEDFCQVTATSPGKKYEQDGGPSMRASLTPLYDVLSAWPIIGHGPHLVSIHKAKLAMAVRSKNAHYKMREIQARHWLTLAQSCCAGDVWPKMLAMTEAIDAALSRAQALLPSDFPAQIWEAVHRGVKSQAALFLEEARGCSLR